MPEMGGKEVSVRLLKRFPGLKIIILSMYDEEASIIELIGIGVHAYLLKNCSASELENTIRMVINDGFYYTPMVAKAMQSQLLNKGGTKPGMSQQPKFSEKEIDLLYHICMGNTNGEIAEIMFYSIRTVEKYRNDLLKKTGRRNTASLVAYAVS